MTLTSSILTGSVKSRALASGFDHVAIGPASPPDHGPALERWLAAGYAGTMSYLERRLGERLDPDSVLPGARSVVCVALNYFPGEPVPDPSWTPVARYAWGRDYHDVMTPRLQALGQYLLEAVGARSRAYVDTGPVLERDLAARAGLGWTGKNTMLLHPDLGSWFLIGVLLTTEVAPLARHGLALSGGVTLYVAASNLVPEFQAKRGWLTAAAFFGGAVAFFLTERLLAQWLR